jgi:uncharacterized protein
MNARQCFVVAWATSVAAGCGSAPIRYYTLAPPPVTIAVVSPASLAVEVRVVHVPPQLNRPGLMVRNGPTELLLLENERWASPVKEEIADALRLELQRRLATGGLSPDYDKLLVQLDVRQLEAEFANRTWLEASYSATLRTVRAPTAEPRTVTCSFQVEQNIQGGYAQIIAGYQRDIAALADAIAAAVASVANSADTACPASSPQRG